MIHIAYAIWFENLNSAIIKTQVYDMLKNIQMHNSKYVINIIAYQPFYKLFSKKIELGSIIQELKRLNIHLTQIPCFKFPNTSYFDGKPYILPFVMLQSVPVLIYFKIIKNISIIHCRSYPITLSALLLKKLLKTKVVFDPRSSYPEEQLSKNRILFFYRIWKLLEKIILKNADVTISITNTYTEHYKKIVSSDTFIEIPNNVDTNKFKINKENRCALRVKFGITDKETIFCYSGSMNNEWNKPSTYAKLIKSMRVLDIAHRFLFLTRNKDKIQKVFEDYKITKNEYIALSCDVDLVPMYLSIADFGLNIMEKMDIRMSIKTVEYLSMGLPVITNSNVLGAKNIVLQYNTGIIMDTVDINQIRELIENKNKLSKICRKVACEYFSTNVISQKYSRIYNTI